VICNMCQVGEFNVVVLCQIHEQGGAMRDLIGRFLWNGYPFTPGRQVYLHELLEEARDLVEPEQLPGKPIRP